MGPMEISKMMEISYILILMMVASVFKSVETHRTVGLRSVHFVMYRLNKEKKNNAAKQYS